MRLAALGKLGERRPNAPARPKALFSVQSRLQHRCRVELHRRARPGWRRWSTRQSRVIASNRVVAHDRAPSQRRGQREDRTKSLATTQGAMPNNGALEADGGKTRKMKSQQGMGWRAQAPPGRRHWRLRHGRHAAQESALRCQERRAVQGTIRVASTRGTVHTGTPLFRCTIVAAQPLPCQRLNGRHAPDLRIFPRFLCVYLVYSESRLLA